VASEEAAEEAAAEKEEEEEEDKEASESAWALTSWQLKRLMDSRATSLFVMDVRPADDFRASRLLHPNCYNVPEADIKAGYRVLLGFLVISLAFTWVDGDPLSVSSASFYSIFIGYP